MVIDCRVVVDGVVRLRFGSRSGPSPAIHAVSKELECPSEWVIRGSVVKGPWGVNLEFNYSGSGISVRGDLGLDDLIYGLGEKALPLNRRRFRVTMWNSDVYGYSLGTDPLYASIPFFIVFNGEYAVGHFLDSAARMVMDFGVSVEDKYTVEVSDDSLDYYVIGGPRIRDVVSRYLELTGKPTPPPRWALGYQQSRYSYYPQSRVLGVAEKLRKLGIPCDAIYLDIHYMKGYRIFTWDEERFPDPRGMVRRLHELGFRVVVIVDPYVKLDPSYSVFREGVEGDYFLIMRDGGLHVVKGWPGYSALPDFTRREVREWWSRLVAEFVGIGIDGIWLDMNEPTAFDYPGNTMSDPDAIHRTDHGPVSHDKVHNAYALYEAMATYDGLMRARPGRRPFILTRAGYAGIQRYAALWTGDNTTSWDHLKLQLPMLLSLSLSGVTMVGADVCGFAKVGEAQYRLDPELVVRWYEASFLMPLFRNHTVVGSRDQEPWALGPRVLSIVRSLIELRYRLMPYIYTLALRSYIHGEPIVRPLVYDYEDDEESWLIEDEFMLGPYVLVAPVLERGATSRRVYLPRGYDWFHLWSMRKLRGGSYVRVRAPLGKPPIFIRSPGVVPMDSSNGLELLLTPGDLSWSLLHDDGESMPPRYSRLTITTEAWRISISEWEGDYGAGPSRITLMIPMERPRDVVVRGTPIEGERWSHDGVFLRVRVKPGDEVLITP